MRVEHDVTAESLWYFGHLFDVKRSRSLFDLVCDKG